MKIGTLSFKLEDDVKTLRRRLERVEIIVDIVVKHKPDFILCSGYSIENTEDLNLLEQKLKEKKSKTILVVEVKKDKDIEKNGHPLSEFINDYYLMNNTHKMFVIDPNKGIIDLGPQFFSTSDELDRGPNKKIFLEEFEKHFNSRIFNIGCYKAIALCCGELNIFKGNKCRSNEIGSKIFNTDIIINPTHDRMGSVFGKLEAKRKYISKKINNRDRYYISSSNWNPAKGQKPSPTLHTIYSNEELLKEQKKDTNDKYEFRLTTLDKLMKMKGKAAIPLLEQLKNIDPDIHCEKTFDWLFVPKKDERLDIENKILEALQNDCKENKSRFSTKKKECVCEEDIYANDDKIKGTVRKLEFDFYLPNYNIAIEFDELQHFTHERGITFAHYPEDGFSYDIERWKKLCEMKKNDSDPPCRDWQRAFRDAVRDIRARENGISLIRLCVKDFNKKTFEDNVTIDKLKEIINDTKRPREIY